MKQASVLWGMHPADSGRRLCPVVGMSSEWVAGGSVTFPELLRTDCPLDLSLQSL